MTPSRLLSLGVGVGLCRTVMPLWSGHCSAMGRAAGPGPAATGLASAAAPASIVIRVDRAESQRSIGGAGICRQRAAVARRPAGGEALGLAARHLGNARPMAASMEINAMSAFRDAALKSCCARPHSYGRSPPRTRRLRDAPALHASGVW